MKTLTGAFVALATFAGGFAASGWVPERTVLAKGVMLLAIAAAFVTVMQIVWARRALHLPEHM